MTARKTLVSAGAVAAGLSNVAHAAGTDTIRIGLVGAGGRGTQDVANCAKSAPGVVIRALGDLFKDRVDACYNRLKKTKQLTADQFQVTPERCFAGWDNHKKVIECVDLVLLCQPPGFRPIHMRDAIEAGVHVFAEKPVAVDPVGVRSVIETARLADEKKLAIVAGTQTRHHAGAIEVMKRIHDGRIGKLRTGACYFLTVELWHRGSDPKWSEMEYQCRNWYYFTWLSGDHIVEQHVHQHDIMNWAFQSPPVKCIATGGRQTRTDPKWGNIWDHFAVEYEYPGGVRVMSLCRQANDSVYRAGALIVGSKGTAFPSRGAITGPAAWTYEKQVKDPSVQEHADLIASIRAAKPLNDGKRVAESSMTAILGRMSAYTGREISWKWAMEASKLDIVPKEFKFGPNPVQPLAVPGQTKLI